MINAENMPEWPSQADGIAVYSSVGVSSRNDATVSGTQASGSFMPSRFAYKYGSTSTV